MKKRNSKNTIIEHKDDEHKEALNIVQTVDVDDFYLWCKIMCELWSVTREPFDGVNSTSRMGYVFRGQENADWSITSSFERAYLGTFFPVDEDRERYLRIKELDVIASFKRDAMQFLKHEPHDDCEWLSLMRHYGAPTRMVDFTESPFIALHFALSDKTESAFAVWAFPANDGYLSRKIAEDGMLARRNMPQESEVQKREVIRIDKRCTAWLADNERIMQDKQSCLARILGRTRNGDPVICAKNTAMVMLVKPQFNNARICAQAGLMAIPTVLSETFMFNAKQTGLIGDAKICPRVKISDYQGDRFFFMPHTMVKFVFQPDMRASVRAFLEASNITTKTLFPDIEGVAKQFRVNRIIDLM